eukprot:6467570-Lingulodinium_polyedra.AAC.1
MALGIWLAVDCYLRPSELLGLHRCDLFGVAVPGAPRRRQWPLVIGQPGTRPAKNGQYDDGAVIGLYE